MTDVISLYVQIALFVLFCMLKLVIYSLAEIMVAHKGVHQTCLILPGFLYKIELEIVILISEPTVYTGLTLRFEVSY